MNIIKPILVIIIAVLAVILLFVHSRYYDRWKRRNRDKTLHNKRFSFEEWVEMIYQYCGILNFHSHMQQSWIPMVAITANLTLAHTSSRPSESTLQRGYEDRYDAYNRLVKRDYFSNNPEYRNRHRTGFIDGFIGCYLYQYDTAGRLIRMHWYDNKSYLNKYWLYEYGNYGHIKTIEYNVVPEIKKPSVTKSATYKLTYNLIIDKINTHSQLNKYWHNEYDAEGNHIKTEQYDADGNLLK